MLVLLFSLINVCKIIILHLEDIITDFNINIIANFSAYYNENAVKICVYLIKKQFLTVILISGIHF